MNDNNKITYFAETDHRNKVPFGIKAEDRSKHVYVIGKTGMGKSTLLENMAVQDIQSGNGMCFVDPHGKTAELLLEYVPEDRIDDVIYFAPFDMEYPMSFNIMEDVGYDKRHLVANGLMSAFKKIWVDAWSARMEYILNNVILALLEYPDSTLLGVNRMLTDKNYRKKVVDNITDPSTRSFWVDEFAKYTDRYTQEATPAIQNKVGQFTANPLIRNIIGQPKSTFDMRKVMDEKKILIINLSKGRIGEGNANLLGSMLITKLYLAAMSRADLQEGELRKMPNFYLFVDEFQSFANESFADILSEARKYKLNLTIAHQYIEQMPEEVRFAVFGNVGTMITFRVGAYDAEVLEKEFAPKFFADDLVNLGFTQIYLKLMINGVSSHPFSARTLPPIKVPEVSSKPQVITRSRELYSNSRTEVDKAISDWYKNDFAAPVSDKKNDVAKHIPVTPIAAEPVFKNEMSGEPVLAKPFQKKLEEQSLRPPLQRNEEEFRKNIGRKAYENLSESTTRPSVASRSNEQPRRPLYSNPQAARSYKQLTPRSQPTIVSQQQASPRPKLQDQALEPPASDEASMMKLAEGATEKVSLQTLRKNVVEKNAEPRGERNKDMLREALRSILEKQRQEIPPHVPSGVQNSVGVGVKDTNERLNAKETEEIKKPQEVPEDVLRKVLDVNSSHHSVV